MNILNTLAPVCAPNGSAVALGYFDGVHLGHRRVLGAAVEYAAAHGLTPAAFTFSLPGGQSLKGGRILSAGQKHARVAALGITAYMEPPFESFRSLSPEDFVNKILVECFAAKAVFCGDNFTFGAYAAGNVDRLKELCAPLGIAVTIVDMAQYGGQTVSSTRIRAALEEGRIEDANAMLGAPYCIDWPVRHGKGIGTSKLGKPTINQNYPADALQPCTGVYLTREDGVISLERPYEDQALISLPGQTPQEVSVPMRTIEDCLTEELRRIDPDEIYAEVINEGWDLIRH